MGGAGIGNECHMPIDASSILVTLNFVKFMQMSCCALLFLAHWE